jgi:hypothetical protein
MFAYVAHHKPSAFAAVFAELFDEFDMTPVGVVQLPGIVIAVTGHFYAPITGPREPVPMLAGHFASFAADTYRRVRIETHTLPCRVLRHHIFSTLHKKALAS